MNGMKSFLTAFTFLVIVFMGIVLTTWAGLIIEDFLSRTPPSKWELLSSPVKFTQIVDMNYVGAWIKADDGNLYYWRFCDDPMRGKCDQPIVSINMSTSIPEDAHKDDRYTVMQKDRPCTGLSGKIIDCAFGSLPGGGPSIGTIFFAVLDDGSLWALRSLPGWGDDQGLFLIFGVPIGLVLGLIAGAFFLARQYKHKD